MTAINNVFVLVIAFVFAAIFIFIFDAHIFGPSLVRQFESRNYLSTTGRVTHSKVDQIILHGSGPTRVKDYVDIGYQYEVNGQLFETNRFRYNDFILSGHRPESSSANSIRVQNIAAAHLVGSQIHVFYNPNDSADALLSPGLDRDDLMLIVGLMLFHIVMLALFIIPLERLRRKRIGPKY
jgi:hypothetical protein